jgi:hypothetical protein
MMRVAPALVLVVACSSPTRSWQGLDGAPSGDASAATDGRPSDAPDPSTCPVGVADGCCPPLVGGGSDPDCPSLACPSFTRSDAIPLDDAALLAAGETYNDDGQGQVALAWTGTDLVLVWNLLVVPYPTESTADLVVERRGPDGAITLAPLRTLDPGLSGPPLAGVTALGYEPQAKLLLYANTPYYGNYKVTALDLAGTTSWHSRLGSLCNTLDASVHVHAGHGKLLVVDADMTCAGSTYQPNVNIFGTDGAEPLNPTVADGGHPEVSFGTSSAYDPASDRLMVTWNRISEQNIRGRFVDVATASAEPGVNLSGASTYGYGVTGVVFDGASYGVLIDANPPCTACNGASTQTFQRWSPTAGYLGTATPMTIDYRTIMPPSLVWTGDGYVVTAMTYLRPTSSSAPPIDDHSQFTSHVWSFAPDGTLREDFDLDASPAIYPQAVWAGGRIAISYVRVVNHVERHYLRYLSCS